MVDAKTGRRSAPGFRLSAVDAVVLAAGALGTWLSWGLLGPLAWLLPIVLGHFFLFCNVFRVRRSYELIWAAVFIVNLTAGTFAGAFSWRSVLLAQLPVTLVAIAAEALSPRYHGVGWRLVRGTTPAADESRGGAT